MLSIFQIEGRVGFQGTDLTELHEHQHRGPEVTLQ